MSLCFFFYKLFRFNVTSLRIDPDYVLYYVHWTRSNTIISTVKVYLLWYKRWRKKNDLESFIHFGKDIYIFPCHLLQLFKWNILKPILVKFLPQVAVHRSNSLSFPVLHQLKNLLQNKTKQSIICQVYIIFNFDDHICLHTNSNLKKEPVNFCKEGGKLGHNSDPDR